MIKYVVYGLEVFFGVVYFGFLELLESLYDFLDGLLSVHLVVSRADIHSAVLLLLLSNNWKYKQITSQLCAGTTHDRSNREQGRQGPTKHGVKSFGHTNFLSRSRKPPNVFPGFSKYLKQINEILWTYFEKQCAFSQ